MLDSYTTLIIGAGAHKPYGFPTSMELKRDIQSMHPDFEMTAQEQSKVRESLRKGLEDEYSAIAYFLRIFSHAGVSGPNLDNASMDFPKKILLEFIEKFAGAGVQTIDRFLSKCIEDGREHYVKAGKLLLTLIINEYEKSCKVFLAEDNWIQFIIAEFLADSKKLEKFKKFPPQIITFNYDTLLERSIVSHLVDYHKYTDEKALEFVENLGVIHVYGKIDFFDDLLDVSFDNASSIDGNFDKVRSSIENLKVVGEINSRNNNITRKLRSILSHSSNIYFLGFGFDDQNMDILFRGFAAYGFDQDVKLLSTNIGLSDYEIKKIKREYPCLKINFFEKEKDKVDSLALLKEKMPMKPNRGDVPRRRPLKIGDSVYI